VGGFDEKDSSLLIRRGRIVVEPALETCLPSEAHVRRMLLTGLDGANDLQHPGSPGATVKEKMDEATDKVSLDTLRLEPASSRAAALSLFGGFLLFYVIQIPWTTSNGDILLYSARALLPFPPLKNYHLGHSLLLWIAYKISPHTLLHTIWPSGFVSALAGALTVCLTFLLGRDLKLTHSQSLWVALVTGFFPSIWYHSLVGEVYSVQLCCIVAFGLFFLRGRVALALLAFLAAMLVSPLSALSCTMVFLAADRKGYLRDAIFVGLFSALSYVALSLIFNPQVFGDAHLIHTTAETGIQAVLERVVRLLLILLINLNVAVPALVLGSSMLLSSQRALSARLLCVALPQLVFLGLDHQFFVELGSFQLPLFWVLTFPIGLYIASRPKKRWALVQIAAAVIMTISVWLVPNTRTGAAYEQAGVWLQAREPGILDSVGAYDATMVVMVTKYQWNIKEVLAHQPDLSGLNEKQLEATALDPILIVETKEGTLRRLAGKLPRVGDQQWDPSRNLKQDSYEKLYENDYITLYKWRRIQSGR
jgi:hypothetical protein